MELYLFSGFLGSGKTTVVTSLAKHMTENNNKKVMLIVNDVGDIGIDAQLMRKLDADVFEIFGGCVCGQLGNLVNILSGIGSKYVVDIVLMEASGIAEPKRFISTIEQFVPEDMKVKTICLVDASRWLDLIQVIDTLLISQIMSSDLVLVNKLDAVDKETLDNVLTNIKSIKKNVPITSISAIDSKDLLNVMEVIENARHSKFSSLCCKTIYKKRI